MTAPLPILIDTDPGLDDAVAILHALSCGGFRVEAMSAVAGNIGIETTTRNIGRLLAAMGQGGIPYAAGAAGPLQGASLNEVAIHGDDGLGGVTLPEPLTAPDPRGGVALLAERLSAAPDGTCTVLALGPLTNLALLRREAPDAYARIGRIIAMGGAIEERGNVGPFAEFNIACDPLAAAEVLAGEVPVTLIPLDVTRRIRATAEDLDRLAAFDTRAATLSADLIRAYFHGNADRASRPLHDPCVMLMALRPELFGVVEMRLAVDLDGDHPGRLTRSETGAPVSAAMEIDAPAALDALWQGLGA
ncbi:nucleoside hydrolase [Gymnodinialimonas ceratoperidinii]|uniref:Nucleoside hydrolase n=1 Tax=Gymnodinialimonas ceratoperidinii TaxID=2856823 RepID=A0A8F6YB46_9RHOB|nr:nucleoside hydrolase [Gymnodinialimonas ceratoperidinii]QXT40599.1 nucleoside hydrolase [Gymnodinialimonas ceratoperidinii]